MLVKGATGHFMSRGYVSNERYIRPRCGTSMNDMNILSKELSTHLFHIHKHVLVVVFQIRLHMPGISASLIVCFGNVLSKCTQKRLSFHSVVFVCKHWFIYGHFNSYLYHWNENVFILMKSSSLAVPKVVKMTTFGAASDETFIKMMTFSFQCM